MKAQTIRGTILGTMVGVTLAVACMSPQAAVEKVKYEPIIISKVVTKVVQAPVMPLTPRVEIDPVDQEYTKEEQYCLAKNIYHEAGVESLKGKIAVGQVTLNRMKTGRWGHTVCEVVYAKSQFSWTLEKDKVDEVPEGNLWEESKLAADEVMRGTSHIQLNNSLFYHTDYIKTPFWVDRKAKVTQIGQHIFYSKALTIEDLKLAKAKSKMASKHKKPVVLATAR